MEEMTDMEILEFMETKGLLGIVGRLVSEEKEIDRVLHNACFSLKSNLDDLGGVKIEEKYSKDIDYLESYADLLGHKDSFSHRVKWIRKLYKDLENIKERYNFIRYGNQTRRIIYRLSEMGFSYEQPQ